jgi:hypothetical protein
VAGLIRLPLQLLLKHALQGAARERPRLHRLRYRPPGGGAAFAWQSWGCYGGDSPPPPPFSCPWDGDRCGPRPHALPVCNGHPQPHAASSAALVRSGGSPGGPPCARCPPPPPGPGPLTAHLEVPHAHAAPHHHQAPVRGLDLVGADADRHLQGPEGRTVRGKVRGREGRTGRGRCGRLWVQQLPSTRWQVVTHDHCGGAQLRGLAGEGRGSCTSRQGSSPTSRTLAWGGSVSSSGCSHRSLRLWSYASTRQAAVTTTSTCRATAAAAAASAASARLLRCHALL